MVEQAPLPQRIIELYCWIATYPDGSEDIITADIEFPDIGLRHTPLLSSQLEVAEKLRPLAERAQQEAATAERPITVRLVTFLSMEGIW